jgi:ribulose-phosphate 3-epimerase
MLPISIVPSLPAQSFSEIQDLADALVGAASGIQVDIVDGVFAPHVSWPFSELDSLGALQQLQKIAQDFLIEMDCMVMHPEKYLDTFVSLGINRVIIHMGSTDKYTQIIEHAAKHSYRMGLAFTNDQDLAEVYAHVDHIDYVQVMGIKEVGKQGQPFDERTLQTVRTLREKYPELEIAVDGAVNALTIAKLYAAGVTRFAPGSAVAKADDPKEAYLALTALLF